MTSLKMIDLMIQSCQEMLGESGETKEDSDGETKENKVIISHLHLIREPLIPGWWSDKYNNNNEEEELLLVDENSSTSEEEENISPNLKFTLLYKTELCNKFRRFGKCPYGRKCKFAHGKRELRKVPAILKKEKRPEICKKYKNGKCPYGHRCIFQHPPSLNEEEMHPPSLNEARTQCIRISSKRLR